MGFHFELLMVFNGDFRVEESVFNSFVRREVMMVRGLTLKKMTRDTMIYKFREDPMKYSKSCNRTPIYKLSNKYLWISFARL